MNIYPKRAKDIILIIMREQKKRAFQEISETETLYKIRLLVI